MSKPAIARNGLWCGLSVRCCFCDLLDSHRAFDRSSYAP